MALAEVRNYGETSIRPRCADTAAAHVAPGVLKRKDGGKEGIRRQEVHQGKIFCQYSCMHPWQIKVNKQCRDSAVPWQARSRSTNMILTADFSRSAFKLFNCAVSSLCTKSKLTFPYLASTFIIYFFESYFLRSLLSPHFVPQKQVLLLLCLTRFLKVCMREKCIS